MRLKGCLYKEGVNGFGIRKFRPPYADLFDPVGCSHDRYYDLGGDEDFRLFADIEMLRGMLEIAEDRESRWLVFYSVFCYCVVRMCGWAFYNYKED